MLGFGILLCLAFPFTGMIDEANSSHIVPLEKIHLCIMAGIISVSLSWIWMSLTP